MLVCIGLKIAYKVALMELPEFGLTYKELASDLFSEARTKKRSRIGAVHTKDCKGN